MCLWVSEGLSDAVSVWGRVCARLFIGGLCDCVGGTAPVRGCVCEVLWGDCVCVGTSVYEACCVSVWACLRAGLRLLGLWVCAWRGQLRLCRAVGRREAMMSAGGLVCGCVGLCSACGSEAGRVG